MCVWGGGGGGVELLILKDRFQSRFLDSRPLSRGLESDKSRDYEPTKN